MFLSNTQADSSDIKERTAQPCTLPGFPEHLTRHCLPAMISWQIWHHVSGTHLTHRPASVRTAHICTQPDSCHSIRMQASQKSALAFQLTQDNAGGKRHSRANHLPERIGFDFRVTFLTGLSWSHQQCQLFMGGFSNSYKPPNFYSTLECMRSHRCAPGPLCLPGLSETAVPTLSVSLLAVKAATRARHRDSSAP